MGVVYTIFEEIGFHREEEKTAKFFEYR